MRDVLVVEEESEARSARNADSETDVEPDANSGRRRQRLVIGPTTPEKDGDRKIPVLFIFINTFFIPKP